MADSGPVEEVIKYADFLGEISPDDCELELVIKVNDEVSPGKLRRMGDGSYELDEKGSLVHCIGRERLADLLSSMDDVQVSMVDEDYLTVLGDGSSWVNAADAIVYAVEHRVIEALATEMASIDEVENSSMLKTVLSASSASSSLGDELGRHLDTIIAIAHASVAGADESLLRKLSDSGIDYEKVIEATQALEKERGPSRGFAESLRAQAGGIAPDESAVNRFEISCDSEFLMITDNERESAYKVKIDLLHEGKIFDLDIVDRSSEIEFLERMIGECTNNDIHLMRDDLQVLNAADEEFVFSEYGTSGYITKEAGIEEFNTACESMINSFLPYNESSQEREPSV